MRSQAAYPEGKSEREDAVMAQGYHFGLRRTADLVAQTGLDGDLAVPKTSRVLCVVSPGKDAYSQTFVRAHIEHLPAEVIVLHGGVFPSLCGDKPLLKATVPHRLMRAILRRALRLPHGHFERRALKRLLLESKASAVLAEFGTTGVTMMDVCEQACVPLIVHFHGFDAYRRSTLEKEGRRYGELFRKAAAIVAVSRDMERQLLSMGAPPEKLHYNPCGADVSVFQGADPRNAPPTFVAVGRFVDKKAPHLTLLSFKKVAESVRNARLIMIGDGPLWEACHQLSKALDIESVVEMPGPRSHHEVAAIMRRARAFIQHSIQPRDGNSEGTPVAVLEAGAAGLPVVATRHAGIKDAVVDGETGFLVDEGDVHGMADRMIRLAEDPDLAARLGEAARRKVLAEFSMGRSINRLWSVIESAIEHPRR